MLTNETIKALIGSHKSKAGKNAKRWERLRTLYSCTAMEQDARVTDDLGENEALVAEHGALFSFEDTMLASIVPLNPKVTMTAISDGATKAAEAREALANSEFRRIKFGRQLRKLTLRASMWDRCFLKATWDKTIGRPRIRVINPHNIFFDSAAEEWDQVRYLVEVAYVPKETFDRRVKGRLYSLPEDKKASPGEYPNYLVKENSSENLAIQSQLGGYVVYEVYDFTDPIGRFLHFVEDLDEPIFVGELPYEYIRNPYMILTLNDNLTDLGGMGDASIVKAPLIRLAELMSIELRHLHLSVPTHLMDESAFEDPETALDQIQNATNPGDIARVKLRGEKRISDAIGILPTPQLTPAFSGFQQRTQQEVSFRLGQPDYSRGQVGGADIATEVALADKILNTRQGHRQGFLYDVVEWAAKTIVALWEEYAPRGQKIPIRREGQTRWEALSTGDLGFRDLKGQTPLEMEIECSPYSPTEDNDVVILQRMTAWLQYIAGNPAINQEDVAKAVLHRLRIDNEVRVVPPQPAQPSPGPGGAAPSPGAANPLAALMGGGNLPPGVAEPAPVPGRAGGAGINGNMGG